MNNKKKIVKVWLNEYEVELMEKWFDSVHSLHRNYSKSIRFFIRYFLRNVKKGYNDVQYKEDSKKFE